MATPNSGAKIIALAVLLCLTALPLQAAMADTPCVTMDDEPLPFKIYFREVNHIIPELNRGRWGHFYGEEMTPASLQRLPDTIADYEDCLAKDLFGKRKKK
jgi:hypothetical protein